MFKRILHIDDDEDDHEIFAAALSECCNNVQVISMNSARQALQQLASAEIDPDIIFLDLNMPEMSGQEFLFELQKTEAIKHIPVIVLSTSSHAPTIELAKENGAKDFFTKPEKLEELVNILKKVLN